MFWLLVQKAIESCELTRNSYYKVSTMALEDGAVDKTTERETWGNPVEFLMSCIAMSVGLGN